MGKIGKARNKKGNRGKAEFSGEAYEPGLNIKDVHVAWDSCDQIRNRLREGGPVMAPETGLYCDNHTCVINYSLLMPLVIAMEQQERKLPSVYDLRHEETILLRMNKRVGPEIADQVSMDSFQIRKLLSHIKAKVRRKEISAVFRHREFRILSLPHQFYLDIQHEIYMLSTHSEPTSQDTRFQELCLAMDPSLQAMSCSEV